MDVVLCSACTYPFTPSSILANADRMVQYFKDISYSPPAATGIIINQKMLYAICHPLADVLY